LEKEYNILEHEMVPEHVILGDEEKKELLNRLKISSSNLPKIMANDPAVKAIGAKEGDVLRIERESPTAGTSTYYRVVSKK